MVAKWRFFLAPAGQQVGVGEPYGFVQMLGLSFLVLFGILQSLHLVFGPYPTFCLGLALSFLRFSRFYLLLAATSCQNLDIQFPHFPETDNLIKDLSNAMGFNISVYLSH